MQNTSKVLGGIRKNKGLFQEPTVLRRPSRTYGAMNGLHKFRMSWLLMNMALKLNLVKAIVAMANFPKVARSIMNS